MTDLTAASTMLDTGTPEAPATEPTTPEAAAPALEKTDAPDAEPGPLVMPGKDATPEQWGEFYKQVGRPDAPEGYELPVPEGDDGAFAKQASGWMHEAGLSKDQAAKLAVKWNELAATQAQAQADADAAAAKAAHEKNTAESVALKTEWGQNFDANMHQAKQAVSQFLPKDQAADIIGAIESKVGYANTIKFLQGIGVKLGEHDAAGLGSNNTSTPQKSLAERLYPSSSN